MTDARHASFQKTFVVCPIHEGPYICACFFLYGFTMSTRRDTAELSGGLRPDDSLRPRELRPTNSLQWFRSLIAFFHTCTLGISRSPRSLARLVFSLARSPPCSPLRLLALSLAAAPRLSSFFLFFPPATSWMQDVSLLMLRPKPPGRYNSPYKALYTIHKDFDSHIYIAISIYGKSLS